MSLTSRTRPAGAIAAAFLALVAVVPEARAQAMKVAVIDIQEVLRASLSGKAALQRLEDAANKKQEFLKQKQKDLEELQKQYNTAPLSGPKRDELEQKIQQLIKEVNRFKEDARLELQKAEEEELKKLEQEVLPLIDQIGKAEGYDMIFGKFQSGLIYMDDKLDITAVIIQKYDAAKKAGTLPKPKAPETPPAGGGAPPK